MKFFAFVFPTLLTVALGFALSMPIGKNPPLGSLFSPFTGFWQNAEPATLSWDGQVRVDGLKGNVTVQYDERRVPHVFAENEEDLYFMQGYLTAKDRLWQMEFITIAASGRVSELIGEGGINYDRTQRRMGITYSAELAVEYIMKDPTTKLVMESYTAGVNAYINSLTEGQMPLEYKLMNYRPELWSPYKTTLLLKFMSNGLAGRDHDFEYTNALNLFGKDIVDLLYPTRSPGIDPVIPSGTPYDFAVEPLDTPEFNVPTGIFHSSVYDGPDRENLGSNNWAVHGSRTNTGAPLLASDPHLELQLPSIWYEMQLTGPGVNVYGATLPGSPCVIIGFNNDVAWGVTNAGMDVRDWYKIELVGESQYRLDGEVKPIKFRYDTIRVKNGPDYIDTVRYTHHGPVMYDEHFPQHGNTTPLALRWTAHDPSNELLTFYGLNRAKSHADYLAALGNYYCPGQNFVFASSAGDIAIRQQANFPKKWPEQGRYIMDGSNSQYDWQGYIPFDQNPQVLNPPRGFVSSANQHPTDSTYPYFYQGYYEYNRSRRINDLLGTNQQYTADDMKRFQNDNYSYYAYDLMPLLQASLDSVQLTKEQQEIYNQLKQWDFKYEANSTAATAFEIFYDTLIMLTWDELTPFGEKGLAKPAGYVTIQVLQTHPNHDLIDYKGTAEKEDASALLRLAFAAAVEKYYDWQANMGKQPEWWRYKNTTVAHWVPFFTNFSRAGVEMGGNRSILNATDGTHGASWRMVVSLEQNVKAWGVYPGGPSGNPGSHFYDKFIDTWAKGDYYELVFLKEPAQTEKVIFTQTYSK